MIAQEEIQPVKTLPALALMTSLPAFELINDKTYSNVNGGFWIKTWCAPLNQDSVLYYVKMDKIEYAVDSDFFLQTDPNWISNISFVKEKATSRVYLEFKRRKEKAVLRLINKSKNLN